MTPSAHRWRRLAAVELAPRIGSTLPTDSVRVASDPHRALEATTSRTASALGSRLRRSRRLDTSAELDGWKASVRAPKSPDRNATPRTRDAIRAARAPIQRIEPSMLPPTVTRHHRWMETMFEEACRAGTLRDAMKRAAATIDPSRLGAPNSSYRPRPKAGRDRTSPYQPPELGRRSETRLLRTLPKCSKMLPPPGCSHRWIAC